MLTKERMIEYPVSGYRNNQQRIWYRSRIVSVMRTVPGKKVLYLLVLPEQDYPRINGYYFRYVRPFCAVNSDVEGPARVRLDILRCITPNFTQRKHSSRPKYFTSVYIPLDNTFRDYRQDPNIPELEPFFRDNPRPFFRAKALQAQRVEVTVKNLIFAPDTTEWTLRGFWSFCKRVPL